MKLRVLPLLAIGLSLGLGCTASGDEKSGAGAKPETTSAAAPATPAATSGDSTFDAFWTGFRAAVAAGDSVSLANRARFPFSTKGTLDQSPIEHWDRTTFLRRYRELLETDAGARPLPEPMRSYVQHAAAIPPSAVTGQTARVGSFAFERDASGWRFVLAYMER